ncbi:MnhB domain-containing protein [Halocalculus aciditolerans]|uniref:Na+/H+ antiporter MnhB subunit-related protein domain-containing protein n=1 Tax=Halocalculus aciditolerans TaxID=1383812 RepID=A0A830FAT5_9EURY|nr:MnhB domain-containing protein [Halocalculus aciditolerans]GGL56583.1 hypothetical protein GCM10009039_13410 [Halocalculus aciditolerans]
MTTVILRTVTRTVVPLAVVVAVALFAQGHNLPGGGFIAGVLTTTAVALTYITYGLDAVEEEILNREPGTVFEHIEHGVIDEYTGLVAAGLGVSVAAACAGVVFMWLTGIETAFFAQSFLIFHHVPLAGELEVASAAVFDAGVYGVVVGALLTVVSVVSAE